MLVATAERTKIEAAIRSALTAGAAAGAAGSVASEWTSDQKIAIDAVLADLQGGEPMLRLLQGDVGTGKTAVALVAAAVPTAAGGSTAAPAATPKKVKNHFRIFGASSASSEPGVRV